MKGCTTPQGSTPPTLNEQQSGFFYVPQDWSEQLNGAYGFSSLSEKTRMSNHL